MLRPALAALLATTSLAQAQESGLGSYLDLLDPDRIVTRFMQYGVLAARTQADVTYDAISSNIRAGETSITGLSVWPLPVWDDALECVVTADRIAITGVPLSELDRTGMRITVMGASATEACLPPEQQGMLAMTGLERIDVPRMTVSLYYDIPSSGLDLRMHAEVDGLATVDAEADFSYAWFDAREDPDNPDPVLFLSEARVSVEDDGGWEVLRAILPPPAANPENAALIAEGAVGSMLLDMNASSGGLRGDDDPATLSEEQIAFTEAAAEAWASFVADPSRLVIETGVEGDIFLDIDAYAENPRALFEDLAPTVDTVGARARAALPAELVRTAYEAPDNLSGEERLRVAEALISGRGAPRNVAAGADLITPLAEAGDAEAALTLARAIETSDPKAAYRRALAASAEGLAGATALLDRIEAALEMPDVVAAQTMAAGTAEEADAPATAAETRARALAHLSGRGAPRSYELASFHARLGAALGDAGSADLLEQIDARTASDPEAFAEAEARAAEAATAAWLARE